MDTPDRLRKTSRTAESTGKRQQSAGRNVVQVISLLWKITPGLMVAHVLFSIVQALIPGVGTYVTKLSLDQLTHIALGDHSRLRYAIMLVLIGAALTLGTLLVSLIVPTIERYMTEYLSLEMESTVIQKAQRIGLAAYDQSDTFDQIQRARSNMGERGVQLMSAIVRVISMVLTLGSYLGLLTLVHWGLTLALIPVFLLALVLNTKWSRHRFALSRAQTPVHREAAYYSQLLCGAETAKEVRLFGLGGHLTEHWRKLYVAVQNQNLSLYWHQNRTRLIINLVTFATVLSVSLFMFWGMVQGQVTVGTYVALSTAVMAAINLMPQVADAISRLYEQALFTGEYFRLQSLPEERTEGAAVFPGVLTSGIEVDNLCFTYSGAEKSALSNVTFAIRPGETIAIVGENGAGKSTLVKCLLGLYPLSTGMVRYDGVDINAIRPDSLRANVTAVFQDFVRYGLSLRENVGFGAVTRMYADDLLDEAARKAAAGDIVDSFPDGWDTRLGRMWENGQELSFGQWQRIAVARALLKDATVVFLDEPTAALDPKAEAALIGKFAEVTRGKTSVVISHRLGTTRIADRILVMKDGTLVEQGSHEELLTRGGEYSRMFLAQAQWYA